MNENASKKNLWAGRIISGWMVVFLLFDGSVKVMRVTGAVEATVRLGYPARLLPALGIVELTCAVLYVIPRTSILGAILLTGYLGGAVATHARIGDPLFSHTLFGVYLGIALWGGLWLRDERVRTLLPVS
jgi:uncharacterized membrane protein YphA (DoxX/SURF4 family)